MVDAAGTTKYTYYASGLLNTEDGPWSSDTVDGSVLTFDTLENKRMTKTFIGLAAATRRCDID